jgi:hypothetical protein
MNWNQFHKVFVIKGFDYCFCVFVRRNKSEEAMIELKLIQRTYIYEFVLMQYFLFKKYKSIGMKV